MATFENNAREWFACCAVAADWHGSDNNAILRLLCACSVCRGCLIDADSSRAVDAPCAEFPALELRAVDRCRICWVTDCV